tara:strand:- start:135 stop:773 length:639 start_codon:yes stop_codon:yes gene_type:complete
VIIGKAMINYNLHYFKSILDCFKYINDNEIGKTEEFINSFSYNQFKSKKWLIDKIVKLDLLQHNTKVTVLGCWFGTVLFPELLKRNVDMIYGYDMDTYVIDVSNRLFKNFNKVKFIKDDIWINKPRYINETNIVINTSCEHMPPMKDWNHYKEGTYIFQSTNVTNEKDHINCVKDIKEFENQMHPMLEILWAGENDIDHIDDGKRFMIVGKI